MITFIDLGPKATVYLSLKVPVPLSSGGWSWGELPQFAGILAREFAYTARECAAVVHSYGRIIGQLLQSELRPDRFTITARGPVTGKVCGMREWQWAATQHEFEPAGEYLCGWRSGLRDYFQLTGELFSETAFRARTADLSVIAQSPCWHSALAPAA